MNAITGPLSRWSIDRLKRAGFVLLLLSCAGACDKGPTTPPPPPAPTLTLLCPSSTTGLAIDSANGTTGTVDLISKVQASGGVPPSTASCPGHTDGVFPVGTTNVTCTGSDSAGQSATCSFPVTVNAVPWLQKTRILAFGDSITYGTDSPPAALRVRSVGLPWSYPAVLQDLLTARYRLQTITVTNAGNPGERVWDTDKKAVNSGTFDRLRTELDSSQAEVLLLMEGVNDLTGDGTHYDAIAGLDALLSEATRRGVVVFVSSLTPSTLSGKGEYIPLYNDFIWALVPRRPGATFVDMYTRFAAEPALIGADGLHPTKDGFKVMAEVWADALKTLETTTPPQPTPATRRVR